MNLQTAKIVNPPSKSCWSQVYIDDGFLAVIRIEKETNPSLRAKEVLSCFHESYASFEGGTFKKLKASLAKVQEEFADLELAIVMGVISQDVLYLGVLNEGKAILLREGSLVTILEERTGVVTASGFLKNGDLFVLGTKSFFNLVTEETLKVSLEKNNLEEIAEILMSTIHEREEDGGVAAVIAKSSRQEEHPVSRNYGSVRISEKILLIKQAMKAVKNWLIGLFSRPGPIYVSEEVKEKEKKQRMMLTVAVILAVLLVISIVFGWQKRRKNEEVEKFNQFWETIEYQYEQAKELVELNPIRSRELLGESLNLARERKDDYHPKSWQYKKIENMEQEIEKELEKVLQKYELATVPIFLDLNLIKKDLRGIDFDFWEKKMVVLGEDGTVITIDSNKKTETLGKVEKGKLVTLWGERAFVLGEKIVEVGQEGEIEKEWGEAVDLKAFAGNLYFLDRERNKIFKIPAVENGFGTKRNWFDSGVEPDLTSAVDMAIDGDIWVLLKDGAILKFSLGAPKAFGVSGLDKELANPSAFYTDKDCQKIYVLDKGNKRIMVLKKSGEYDSQYLWEGIEGIDDLVVDEDNKKILLLARDKIFQIDIK